MPRARIPYRSATAPRRSPVPYKNDPFDVLVRMEKLRELCLQYENGITLVQRALASFDSVKQGRPGNPGRRGNPGTDGRNVTDAQVEAAVTKILQQPKDGVAPTAEEVAASLISSKQILRYIKKLLRPAQKNKDGTGFDNSIVTLMMEEISKRKFTIDDIQGLDGRFAELRNQIAMSSGDGVMRGGGDTVVAGTGVTITNTRNGNKQISASGGSLSQETPSGTVDGSNNVFTVTHSPVNIVVDGLVRPRVTLITDLNGNGYTYSAGTITVAPEVPPVQFIVSYYAA